MPPIKKSRNQTKKTNENCVSIALTRNRRRNGNYYQNKTNVSSAIVSDEKNEISDDQNISNFEYDKSLEEIFITKPTNTVISSHSPVATDENLPIKPVDTATKEVKETPTNTIQEIEIESDGNDEADVDDEIFNDELLKKKTKFVTNKVQKPRKKNAQQQKNT